MTERLLTIDVEAALRKVSIGRLRSRDQVPLALARCLARQDPDSIRIRLRRSRLQIETDGRALAAEGLEKVRLLLDRQGDEIERHAALEQLEAQGLLDLLVAFTAGAKTVLVQAGPPTNLRLVAGGGRLVLDRGSGAEGFSGNLLVLNGLEGNPGQQIRELDEHLRFAPFKVQVNRTRLDRGLVLNDAVLQRSFSSGPIDGLVGLPVDGLAARTSLVVDGVVERQIWDSPPSGAAWDAVVRCPAGFDQRALAMVSSQVAGLYRDIAGIFSGLPSGIQERLRQLVYRLGDCGAGASAVAGIPIFKRTGGEAVEADALKAAARGRLIRAIGPDAKASRYDLSGQVFVLDDRDRGFVERHLGLMVREPARQATQASRLWRLAGRLRGRLRRVSQRAIRRLALGQPVHKSALTPAEQRFLEALQAALAGGVLTGQARTRVVFCLGGLAGWRWLVDGEGLSWLQLGRANRTVRSMVRAFEDDPRNLFPALVLLGDGRDDLFSDGPTAEALAGLTGAVPDTTLPPESPGDTSI